MAGPARGAALEHADARRQGGYRPVQRRANLARAGLLPLRPETLKGSQDKECDRKFWDVTGLHLDPPALGPHDALYLIVVH